MPRERASIRDTRYLPVAAVSAMSLVYALLGAFMLFNALANWRRRTQVGALANAGFWGLLGVVVVAADWLPLAVVGVAVIVAAGIAASGHMRALSADPSRADPAMGLALETAAIDAPVVGTSPARAPAATVTLGDRIFIPALLIPAITVAGVFGFKAAGRAGYALVNTQQATLLALAVACVVAAGVASVMTRSGPRTALVEGGRLLDAIGWAAILPLLLAMLGSVFAETGVGDVVAELMRAWVPTESRLACVLAYALGMALFTMLMGNAFAAFPVLTAGIGLPLLVAQHGADAASLAAIGMLSGYCGTLLTPMAANYNLVPAALLELPDRYGVIRAQVATALPLLACNIALMYFIPFRGT